MLSGDLSTASQSSTGAHAEGITATWYYKLYGGHWLPPSSGASGSSICWASCRLHQLCCWSCLQRQLPHCVSLYTLFAEPTVDRRANGEAGTEWAEPKELQMRFFSPGWGSSRSSSHDVTPHTTFRALPGGAYIHLQTKSSPWPSECLTTCVCSECYKRSQLLHNRAKSLFTDHGAREPQESLLLNSLQLQWGLILKVLISLSHTLIHTHTPYTR